MRAFLSKLRKDVTGNVLVLSGAGAVALVGGAGLGVDTVQWYLWKRQLQQSVDSGALAGGNALAQGSSYRTYATKEVNRNANTTVSIVRLANPPASGAYTGDTGAVEVIATTRQSLPFSSVFLDAAPTLRARAVATTLIDGEYCMRSLAPTGVGVHVAGTADIALGCGVSANSRDLYAFDFDGGAHLSATPLSAVGGIDYTSGNVDPGTTIQSYGVEQLDPYAGQITMSDVPPLGGCDENNFTVKPSESLDLYPDHHTGYSRLCNGLTVRGDLTLHPGVYVIDGGTFQVNSSATINAQGVTIILTGSSSGNVATVNMQGGATVNMRAPNAADEPSFKAKEWYGVLFFQDPSASTGTTTNSNKLTGDSGSSFEGIVYMPKANFTLTGSSGMSAQCLRMVTYRVDISGEATVGNSCPSDITDYDVGARIVRVVE